MYRLVVVVLVGGALLVLSWAVLVAACGGGSGSASPRSAGEDEPSVLGAVVGLDGRAVDPLAADAPATVLLFVSTHCPISNRYAPTMREQAEAWRARGVVAWLVALAGLSKVLPAMWRTNKERAS